MSKISINSIKLLFIGAVAVMALFASGTQGLAVPLEEVTNFDPQTAATKTNPPRFCTVTQETKKGFLTLNVFAGLARVDESFISRENEPDDESLEGAPLDRKFSKVWPRPVQCVAPFNPVDFTTLAEGEPVCLEWEWTYELDGVQDHTFITVLARNDLLAVTPGTLIETFGTGDLPTINMNYLEGVRVKFPSNGSSIVSGTVVTDGASQPVVVTARVEAANKQAGTFACIISGASAKVVSPPASLIAAGECFRLSEFVKMFAIKDERGCPRNLRSAQFFINFSTQTCFDTPEVEGALIEALGDISIAPLDSGCSVTYTQNRSLSPFIFRIDKIDPEGEFIEGCLDVENLAPVGCNISQTDPDNLCASIFCQASVRGGNCPGGSYFCTPDVLGSGLTAACSAHAECLSGNCNGTCQSKFAAGIACNTKSQCSSNDCDFPGGLGKKVCQ